MERSEAEGDLVLIQTFSALLWKLFLKNTSKHKNNLIYIIKQEGLYQNKVTLSLASIHNCKMALCLPCSRLMPTLSIWHHRTFRQFFSLVHVVTLSWPRELQLVPYSNTRKQKRWNSTQFSMYDCNFDQAFLYVAFSLDPISRSQACDRPERFLVEGCLWFTWKFSLVVHGHNTYSFMECNVVTVWSSFNRDVSTDH